MRPWHEDDAFWATWRPAMFGAERWERAPEEVEQALELLHPPDGARILDLCCGPGRHSLELARRGFRVTAVDRTEEYLRSLREAAADEGLEVEAVLEDMRRYRQPAAFDAAINLFTSFGYFEDEAEIAWWPRTCSPRSSPAAPCSSR
ncbi:MAG: class I SAM-dependent methyltransferase [Armatimonadota bacterium]|nr:class I SAM-dependent methyltransferase [Armatimonadota bacterium]